MMGFMPFMEVCATVKNQRNVTCGILREDCRKTFVLKQMAQVCVFEEFQSCVFDEKAKQIDME